MMSLVGRRGWARSGSFNRIWLSDYTVEARSGFWCPSGKVRPVLAQIAAAPTDLFEYRAGSREILVHLIQMDGKRAWFMFGVGRPWSEVRQKVGPDLRAAIDGAVSSARTYARTKRSARVGAGGP
jgi:hypothetical protein